MFLVAGSQKIGSKFFSELYNRMYFLIFLWQKNARKIFKKFGKNKKTLKKIKDFLRNFKKICKKNEKIFKIS